MNADARHANGWGSTVRAFGRALRQRHTYAVHRNPYVVFGVLWGLPIPLTTLVIACVSRDWPVTPGNCAACLADSPWQWWFVLHPLLFGVVFGAIGTVATERADRIQELLDELQVRADTDALTGLLNRRSFDQRLHEEAARAERDGRPVSLLFCDLDHFKEVNDRHGHLAGDLVLAEVATRMRRAVRPYDVVARYGGEEFAIILPENDEAEAATTAERIRSAVEDRPFEIGAGQHARVTISIGAAERQAKQPLPDWVRAADESVYEAKRSGRNVVRRATGRHPRPPASPLE